jgi:transcriptional regulator with XRE-family HTH domain
MSSAKSGAASGAGFVAALGVRLRELRQGAGLSLVELAHLMGREPSFYSHLSRLEHGRFKYPSLVLVADYLRACRASFSDLLPVLSTYTDRPPVREARIPTGGFSPGACFLRANGSNSTGSLKALLPD